MIVQKDGQGKFAGRGLKRFGFQVSGYELPVTGLQSYRASGLHCYTVLDFGEGAAIGPRYYAKRCLKKHYHMVMLVMSVSAR